MADSALQRYLKDKQLQEQTPKGKNRDIEELKESFQTTLENLTEPTAPVKYLRPLKPRKKEDGTLRDTSALRFSLFLNPSLRTSASITAGQDIVKKLESEDDKDYISGLDEVRKGIETGVFDLKIHIISCENTLKKPVFRHKRFVTIRPPPGNIAMLNPTFG